jgi:SAM-dependent methyltransferase
MSVSIVHRETCRLCDSPSVELVMALAPIPLSEKYAADRQTALNEPRYPVDLYMCAACGHVQHLDVIDSKSLWENYTYYSGEAKGMTEHFNEVAAEVLSTYLPPAGSLVLDIGSNDGSLLKPFKNAGHRVLGVDPATAIAEQACASGIPTIPALMSLELGQTILREYGPAHVVCMFNAFAHADNLGEVLDAIRTSLAPDGVFIFEAQYLLDIIDGMLIATIFHEHMSHHSVKPLVQFLERHGLELVSVKRVRIQHGSLIGTVQLKGGPRKVDSSVEDLLELEAARKLEFPETLRQFASRFQKQKEQMGVLVQKWKQTSATVAGYGAARSGPTLIAQVGLGHTIEFIVDDHPQKMHRYTSGDGIYIYPTAELCSRMPDYCVILAWVHSAKIIESNRAYLEKGGRFVVLCPEPRIVGKDGDIEISTIG